VEQSFVTENNKSREKLRNLVKGITDKELQLKLYKEGWTVAVALGHIAFWDQRRLLLIRKWKRNGVAESAMDETITNDALLPLLLAIPPREAADLCISIAEELDGELGKLTPELIAAIKALGDRHALNRAIHRKMHLDDIEALLQPK
jgi:hypothetical protein